MENKVENESLTTIIKDSLKCLVPISGDFLMLKVVTECMKRDSKENLKVPKAIYGVGAAIFFYAKYGYYSYLIYNFLKK